MSTPTGGQPLTDDALQALLDELEASLAADVTATLGLTAQDFADALDVATELVAARFSVSGIRGMWQRRVGIIVDKLKRIATRGADAVAEDVGEELPDGWDAALDGYTEATAALLNAVGDRLAAEASQSLAEGLNAGEDLDQLKARLSALFADSGSQLGPGRASRIAMTEATRAFNAGTLAAAQAMTGPERPLVKQWLTRNDERVRLSHREANGQLQLLDDTFDVGGTPMQYPGDPTAPAAETVNCRCILRTATASATASAEGIRMDQDDDLSAAADVHTGAMIALMPTEADAARLALDGWEAADQLHLTLFYLGEAADWTAEQQGALISRVSDAARILTPMGARVFGASQWNPGSDEPAWVWNVGNDNDTPGSRLEGAKFEVNWILDDDVNQPELPEQYTPWAPHICAGYGATSLMDDMVSRVGPVTFDRIRVAFAGRYTDIPLTGGYFDELDQDVEPEQIDVDLVEGDVSEPPLLTWSMPGDTALAFENQQTGDGRVFAPGALYWEDGPWPLQYAEEMNGGHNGARLAGAIYGMGREGDRVTGDGVLYLTQSAGQEAAMLLAQGAPLGVSVDLDDVDLEVRDNSQVYVASLVTASMLPLPDGGYWLTGETAVSYTASGSGTVGESARIDIIVDADGRLPAEAFELSAAAGDSGNVGQVVQRQMSGEVLMRVTRARVRGATLVSIPAYSKAKIVLDRPELFASDAVTAAAAGSNGYDVTIRKVRKSLTPMTAGEVARATGIPVTDVRRYLGRGVKRGQVARIAHGRYVNPEVTLPNGYKKYNQSGSDMKVRAEGATSVAAAATPVADELDELDELAASGNAFEALVYEEMGADVAEELSASAWAAMKDLPAMPAAWFATPTDAELPPGGPGVNYKDGRVFGWVAQAGEPHAGFAKKVTIDGLGRIETQHFLRQRFTLDDGSVVKAGAFTMNVGHHRDGAECETSACQFDDTRTVAGIVTVGMSDRGMWFSGAAAPWMSEWDRNVFLATQPSYHLRKGASGSWQLRAVLAVPVPGHSSPLLASAVVDRSNLALTAAATMLEVEEAVAAADEMIQHDAADATAAGIDYDRLADSMVAAMARAEQRKLDEAAELAELISEAGKLDADTTGTEGA